MELDLNEYQIKPIIIPEVVTKIEEGEIKGYLIHMFAEYCDLFAFFLFKSFIDEDLHKKPTLFLREYSTGHEWRLYLEDMQPFKDIIETAESKFLDLIYI
jgi:L-rhamnose mutarotase